MLKWILIGLPAIVALSLITYTVFLKMSDW